VNLRSKFFLPWMLLLVLHQAIVWAGDTSTECQKVNEAAAAQFHEVATWELNSDAVALAQFEARKQNERNKSQSILETHRQELERRFPGAKIRYLAKGAESAVFSVEKDNQPPLAVKVPLKQGDVRRVIDSYAQERQILALAASADPEGSNFLMRAHPGPRMNFHGIWIEPLVMDKGEKSLKQWLPELGPKTDPLILLRLWREMALGARAVARAEFVHRDIKPGNWIVIVGADGQKHLYLSDFGIARKQGASMENERLQGTLGFMSENQRTGGSPQRADDLHSLIISMKETLIGKEIWNLDPAKPEDHVDLIEIQDWGRYPVLRGLPESTKAAANPLLVQLLLKNHPTIDSLIADIDGIETNLRKK